MPTEIIKDFYESLKKELQAKEVNLDSEVGKASSKATARDAAHVFRVYIAECLIRMVGEAAEKAKENDELNDWVTDMTKKCTFVGLSEFGTGNKNKKETYQWEPTDPSKCNFTTESSLYTTLTLVDKKYKDLDKKVTADGPCNEARTGVIAEWKEWCKDAYTKLTKKMSELCAEKAKKKK